MGLHQKVDLLRTLSPDVAVVPECACPEILLRREPDLGVADLAWTGKDPRKGLGVFSFGAWRLRRDPDATPALGTTLPLEITGLTSLRLLAVWHPHRRPRLADVLEAHSLFLSCRPVVLAGDLNHGLVKRCRDGSIRPSRLARELLARGFVSAYHLEREVSLGAEKEATFFLNRRMPVRHHVDYCLLDASTAPMLRRVTVGPVLPWLLASDHLPLVVEIGGQDEGVAIAASQAQTKIQKCGNSPGLRMPRSFPEEAGVQAGSAVDLSIRDGDEPAYRRGEGRTLGREIESWAAYLP